MDPVPLLRALAAAGVDHIVIGGFAVISYGVVRVTKDLDICPSPDRRNLGNLAVCLAELRVEQLDVGDFDESELPFDPTRADDLAQGGNFRLQTPHGILDVMQWVSGIDSEQAFDDLALEAVDAEVEGVPVRICSLADLRAMKRAAGRPQDLQDLADLAIAHGDDG
ncbi:MAG: hypothetical protein QOJ35_2125 [Solirubrobacteraceae bacterium]|nr:hypothetical protein [Solirubrobacteraceae bacterium]